MTWLPHGGEPIPPRPMGGSAGSGYDPAPAMAAPHIDWERIGNVSLGEGVTVRAAGFGGAWLTGPGTYGPPPDLDDILTRGNDAVLDACDRDGIAFLPWFPPAPLEPEPGSALATIACHRGVHPTQVGLAWLVARAPVTVPLPGTPDPAVYERTLAGLGIELEPDEIRSLSAAAGRS